MQAKFAPARYFTLATLLVLAFWATGQAQTSIRLGDIHGDDERLEQALAQRSSLSVIDMPLNELVEKLSVQFRVPIALSPKKLEEAGVNLNAPVTRQIESAPLESILRLVLDELELDFTIRHSVILVSTPEDLESPDMMEMRIYPVRDLVLWRVPGDRDGGPRFEADYDSLIEVITTSVAPESWSDVGGPGSVKEFDNSEALVISQTRRVHRDIAHLLTTLRKVKQLQGIASLPAPKSASMHVADRPAAGPPQQVTAAPPQTWQVPQVYAEK